MIALAGKLRNSDWCKNDVNELDLATKIDAVICTNKDGGYLYIQKGYTEIREKLIKLLTRA